VRPQPLAAGVVEAGDVVARRADAEVGFFFCAEVLAAFRVRVVAASEYVDTPTKASETPRRTSARTDRDPASWSILLPW
jgi:hypothetical protein